MNDFIKEMEQRSKDLRDPKLDHICCRRCGHIKAGHIDHIDASPGQCNAWVNPN